MNYTGAGTFAGVVKTAMIADVTSLLQATATRVSVEIDTPGGSSFDVRTGVSAPSLTQDATTGWLSDLTQREIDESGGAYQIGDRRLMIPRAGASTAPVVGTTFRSDSVRYTVVSVVEDPIGAFYTMIARRTGAR